MATDTRSHGTDDDQPQLASVVVFVSELDRSVTFYSALLNVHPALRTETAALLVGAGGWQLYLRALGDRASRALGGVGPQYVLWSVDSEAALERCTLQLQAQSSQVSVTHQDGFQVLEGCDPDGQPVIITYPGTDVVPRKTIIQRIYEW